MTGPLARAFAALWPYLDALPPAEVAAFERRAALVESAARAEGVDVAMVAAVCWRETRLGAPRRGETTSRPFASLCGVRIAHRYIADDARSAALAARSLRRHRARCGSWPAAVSAYRTDGVCGAVRGRGYAAGAVALAGRLGPRYVCEVEGCAYATLLRAAARRGSVPLPPALVTSVAPPRASLPHRGGAFGFRAHHPYSPPSSTVIPRAAPQRARRSAQSTR